MMYAASAFACSVCVHDNDDMCICTCQLYHAVSIYMTHLYVYVYTYVYMYVYTHVHTWQRYHAASMHLCVYIRVPCVYIRVPCSVRIHVYVQHPCTCVPDRCAGRVGQDKLAKFVISVAPSRGHTLRRCAHPLCVSCLSFCGSLPGVFWLGSRCAACFSVA